MWVCRWRPLLLLLLLRWFMAGHRSHRVLNVALSGNIYGDCEIIARNSSRYIPNGCMAVACMHADRPPAAKQGSVSPSSLFSIHDLSSLPSTSGGTCNSPADSSRLVLLPVVRPKSGGMLSHDAAILEQANGSDLDRCYVMCDEIYVPNPRKSLSATVRPRCI